jgi:hypothetical protein
MDYNGRRQQQLKGPYYHRSLTQSQAGSSVMDVKLLGAMAYKL